MTISEKWHKKLMKEGANGLHVEMEFILFLFYALMFRKANFNLVFYNCSLVPFVRVGVYAAAL